MKIVKRAKTEKVVLSSVKRDASASDIRESIVVKAQCCVDHLCGCK